MPTFASRKAVLAIAFVAAFSGTTLAFAGASGNGHGGGIGNGNAGGNGHVSGNGHAANTVAVGVIATNSAGANGKNKGNLHSRLGSLNAAHASVQAFAHASPNSRIGKLKAYYLAEVAAKAAAAKLTGLQDAVDTATQALADAAKTLADAQAAAAAKPADQTLTDAAKAAQMANDLAQANLDAANRSLADAQAKATAATQLADADLTTAANKNPVSDAARTWLNAILAGKITVAQ